MTVKRIVRSIAAEDPARARSFYVDVVGLEPVMDHGWIATFASPGAMRARSVSPAKAATARR